MTKSNKLGNVGSNMHHVHADLHGASVAHVAVDVVHPPVPLATFPAISGVITVQATAPLAACARWPVGKMRWFLRSWDGMINNLNVCATGPHLISFLAIPPPAQDVLPWLVGHLDVVHDRPPVLSRAAWAQISLREFIETRLKLGSCGAGRRCAACMPATSLASALRDGIGSPVGSVRRNVGAGINLLVWLRVIVEVDGRVANEFKDIALEALLVEGRILGTQTVAVSTRVLSAQPHQLWQ